MSKKLGILSLLIILSGFGCKSAPDPVVVTPVNQSPSPTTSKPAAAAEQEVKNKQTAADYQVMQKVVATDTDVDGLSNEKEKALGTNPTNADSDADGLLDGDEITLFKTDPLKADTDGDGMSDGKEIKSGKNPLKK